jgi:hypothetical protein
LDLRHAQVFELLDDLLLQGGRRFFTQGGELFGGGEERFLAPADVLLQAFLVLFPVLNRR